MVRSFWWAPLLVLLSTAPIKAHALDAECWVRGNRLEVKAYFSDGTRAAAARIYLLDANGSKLDQGRMNDEGLWSCDTPGKGQYRVIVDAGAGHRVEKRVVITTDAVASSSEPLRVSEGVPEEEFTQFPILKVVLGIGAILGFAATLWLIRRMRKPPPLSSSGPTP